MASRYGYRRRIKPKTAKIDKFSVLLIGQTIICGIIFLILILIKTFNAGFYSSIETSVGASFIGNKNLFDLNVKINSMVQNNPYFSKIFGPNGAVAVFGRSRTKSESSSSSAQSSSSGSESQSGGADSDILSSSAMSSSDSQSGIGEGIGDGDIFKYNFLSTEIMRVYGLLGEIEEEDIIVSEENDETPENVSYDKITPPETVYKPLDSGEISSPFGFRDDPFTDARKFHTGLDIAVGEGTAVKAAMSGTVYYTGYSKVGGNYIMLKHDNGFYTYYGHLKKVLVKKDQTVSAKTKIAYSGNTGNSTGPHLHFEIRQNDIYLNPALYVNYD